MKTIDDLNKVKDAAEGDVEMFKCQFDSQWKSYIEGTAGVAHMLSVINDLQAAFGTLKNAEFALQVERAKQLKLQGELAEEQKQTNNTDADRSMQQITKIEKGGKGHFMVATLKCGHTVRYRYQHEEVGFYLFCRQCLDDKS